MTVTYTYSGNIYETAAAGTTTFALTSSAGNSIDYLQRAHIHVHISDDNGDTWQEKSRPGEWDFDPTAHRSILTTGIAAGQYVRVLRVTPILYRFVDFANGSLLTAGQLDQAEDFSRYVDQEQTDWLQRITGAFSGPGDLVTLNGLGDVTLTDPVQAPQFLSPDPISGKWVNRLFQLSDIPC